MSVKRSRSAARVLVVLEALAGCQPIGVSELARRLNEDKSATQRALMTLADDGWIRVMPGSQALWELTPRIMAMARPPHSIQDLRRRAREVLALVRRESGETVFLTVPDVRRFVIVDALESGQVLRMVPPVGMSAPVRESATGRAILPHLACERQAELLGAPPSPELLEAFRVSLARGYAISDGDIDPASISLAAPIFGATGEPVGAVVVAGPRARIDAAREASLGALLMQAAATLSTGEPRPPSVMPASRRPGAGSDRARAIA